MDSFGATLKKEREERGLALDTVAALIHIDRASLEALERDELDRLPDHESMLAGLRHYAECLHVDSEMMIEHYERERRLCTQRLAERVAEQAPPTRSDAAIGESRPSASPRALPRALVGTVAVVTLIGIGAWWFAGDGGDPVASLPATATTISPTGETANAAAAPTSALPGASSTPKASSTPPATSTPTATATPVTTSPGRIAVPEYGVGTGVRGRQLVGRSDRFGAGTQAWFWTRVEGGKHGETIDHVWLHEGVETARIALSIGGSRWRTQSSKTLRSTGAWAVEARDARGRVLARTEFDCVR